MVIETDTPIDATGTDTTEYDAREKYRERHRKHMILVTGGSGSGKSEYAEELAVKCAMGLAKKEKKHSWNEGDVSRNSAGEDSGNIDEHVDGHTADSDLIYLATMSASGEEARRRIDRHRRMRENKNFLTVEDMYLESDIDKFRGRVVLLEDLSNLLSNYMFRGYATDSSQNNDASLDKYSDKKQNEKLNEHCVESSNDSIDDNEISRNNHDNEEYGIITDIIFNKLLDINAHAGELIVVTNEIFSDGIAYDADTMGFIWNLANLNRRLAKQSSQFTEVVCGIPLYIKK